ncbi:MAG: hypothetical protein K2L48_00855 [Mycoplasmoidaceae bacterium]|nr:hypothetical protein [Mycoplasmoidaceae bacterium]
MVEIIADHLIHNAWKNIGGDFRRISINSKKIKIKINKEYVENIKNKEIKEFILKNISNYYYSLSVDRHIYIDNKFVLGIECKAYAENAMIKRILIDFYLLKKEFKNLECCLLQLESQLTGDYSQIYNKIIYGSRPTHTIMSYFKNVELNIITLLEGERKVDKPIHSLNFFKELELKSINNTIKKFEELLKKYL